MPEQARIKTLIKKTTMERLDKNRIIQSAILALGLLLLGCCIKWGIDDFANKDRKVTVKGLSEREVMADKVTWPISSKVLGDDLPKLYSQINAIQGDVKSFLLKNGVKDNEISINAPTVIDLTADQYNNNYHPYRYNVTTTITVTSNNVKLIRNIINRQGELLKQGIAIVSNNYDINYEYVSFQKMKPKMMEDAIANAEHTAEQFAKNSHSKLNKIVSADQGQFSIEDRDGNTPWIKKVRVVTTITYSLKN